MNIRIVNNFCSVLFICFINIYVDTLCASETQQLVGVNIAGAEFNANKMPGKHGFDYLWPSVREIERFAEAGFTVIRVPFSWPRLQPELNGPLDLNELKNLDAVVNAGKKNNIKILIDPHNYGSYRGNLIGSAEVPVSAFADFWKKLSSHLVDKPHVIFGLMNEPNKQTAEEWSLQAQMAIDAIRQTGAKQLILVPGTRWSGAHSWINSGNAAALARITDPENNFAFEMHQYFDDNSSGTHPNCVSATIGVQRLEAATDWLKTQNKQAFLGEFGASKSDTCIAALDNTLKYLAANKDTWLGWTYWAAGKWWGNYMYSIQSLDALIAPQISIIKKYLK